MNIHGDGMACLLSAVELELSHTPSQHTTRRISIQALCSEAEALVSLQHRHVPAAPQLAVAGELEVMRRFMTEYEGTGHADLATGVSSTTVVCWHGAIAQKSYGLEKRFLCPPPMVRFAPQPIVTAEAVRRHMWLSANRPLLAMSVISDQKQENPPEHEQKVLLDEKMVGEFRFLHVSCPPAVSPTPTIKRTDKNYVPAPKQKHFVLRLKLMGATNSNPYAVMHSEPISIISKPSKKSSKSKHYHSGIADGSIVCLFNRINSQTVRTRYLGTDDSRLCARQSRWSPFRIHLLSAKQLQQLRNKKIITVGRGSGAFIHYGSVVILEDVETSVQSEPLILRKVERGRVVTGNPEGPVSQMQKVALEKWEPLGSSDKPLYLCADPILLFHADVSVPVKVIKRTNIEENDKCKRQRIFAEASSDTINNRVKFVGVWNSPSSSSSCEVDSVLSVGTDIDDYLCWTIIGVSSFTYTYHVIGRSMLQESSIPFPSLTAPPVYDENNGTVTLQLQYFQEHQVWIGSRRLRDLKCDKKENETCLRIEGVWPASDDLKWSGNKVMLKLALVRNDGLVVGLGVKGSLWITCY